MSTLTYKEKLLDPRWQRKRLEIYGRDEFTCRNCGSNKKTLNLHHKYYLHNTEPWDYPDSAFITLCFECHEIEGIELESCTSDLISILKQSGAMAQDFRNIAESILCMDKSKFELDMVISFICHLSARSDIQEIVFDKLKEL